MIAKDELVTVRVTTIDGDKYVFPSVSKQEAGGIAKFQSCMSASSSMILVNASAACLSVPVRIIRQVEADGRVVWTPRFDA